MNRVIAEAASLKAQGELLGLLRNVGAEITLDTRIAELSEPGSHVPSAQWLTSVEKTRPMTPRDFSGDGSRRIAVEVATLAVENAIDAVLVPSHFVIDARSPWWGMDLKLCADLRQALDEMGGSNVRSDFNYGLRNLARA